MIAAAADALLRRLGVHLYEVVDDSPVVAPTIGQAEPAQVGRPRTAAETVRPRTFDEYIGQADAKARLQTVIQAACLRGEQLRHILVSAPHGLGKTTLARLIADEYGAPLVETTGGQLMKSGALAETLMGLPDGAVLFIDEIHGVGLKGQSEVAEQFYAALDSFVLQGMRDGQPVSIPLPSFTCIGATTAAGRMDRAFVSRFLLVELTDYEREDMVQMVEAMAAKLDGLTLPASAAGAIADRSRMNPRQAEQILAFARDAVTVRGTVELRDVFQRLGLGELGLRRRELTVLGHLQQVGGPVGAAALANMAGVTKTEYEDSVEPWLERAGLIIRTPRGRLITRRGVAQTTTS